MAIKDNDATELHDENGQIDDLDRDLDGTEDPEHLDEMADANRPYGEVTAQDLGTQDLVDDGADAASASISDDEVVEHRVAGVVPVDEEIVFDEPRSSESLEDRIQQEVPDPATDIVPPDAGRRA
ncbi:hypothetical protein GCM10027030_01480 [Luteococcus sediminum]|uniref:hypothetical protein n=1 Tax=Luteococcus sp. TaxID=1969402 RepID=UPI003735900F